MFHHLGLSDAHMQLMMWIGGLLVFAVIVLGIGLAIYRWRHAQQAARIHQLFSISDLTNSLDLQRGGKQAGRSVDALFVLPDISNYTRFVMSGHLAPDQAQDVIFGLMSAIIKEAGNVLSFSKMEGDSALFFTDAKTVSPETIGKTISRIFVTFDRQKAELMGSFRDDTRAQSLVSELDLKILVHRGHAQRFTYRGTVDHFGSEVTLLHKLLKNRIPLKRYVLVTDAASHDVSFDATFKSERSSEEYADAGRIEGRIFTAEQYPNADQSIHNSTFSDSMVGSLNNQKWKPTMKIKALSTAAIMAIFATSAFATDYTKGQVTKIKSGKVTIKHEELKNLDMPAMTMVFVPKDDAVMAKLKEGKNIEFVAERIKGKLTLVEVK